MLKAVCLFAIASFAFIQTGGAESREAEQVRETGRIAAGALMTALLPALTDALEAEGPAHAVDVCSEKAMDLTGSSIRHLADVSDIRRISEKTRNPANRPDTGDLTMLKQFQRRLPDTGPESLIRWIEHEDGRREAVYYQGLYIQPMCLPCHGADDQRPESVNAILRERYPDDEAVGYQPGDFRGAIRVVVTVKE